MTQNKLESYGCETFIGRELFADGRERIVAVNLHSRGSVNYPTLEQVCRVLCEEIKFGRRVLLFKSPVKDSSQETNYLPLKLEQMQILGRLYDSKEEMMMYPHPFLNQPE